MPTLTLPTAIQRRFISFILKRSLGHLLKPGQLDIHQIDSQIGNGYVEVKDLELDSNAINAYLAEFPVRLRTGSLGKVTARIPWPNPLSSSLSLSVSGLRLSFTLLPGINSPRRPVGPAVNLQESVASVADSFIHGELSPREEATLRKSFHPHLEPPTDESYQSPPGSIDPFLTGERQNETVEDTDPAGISVFAALIERLLARFELDATDVQVALLHPDHASFVLSVPEIHYGTEIDEEEKSSGSSGRQIQEGKTRKIRILGLTISMLDLFSSRHDHSAQSPLSSAPSRTSSHSGEGYGSDIDEDTQFMMSQSIVSLPPRPTSPPSPTLSTASATSTVYQSAISSSRSPLSPVDGPQIEGRAKAKEQDSAEYHDVILSLASEPIVIRLTHPSPFVRDTDAVPTEPNKRSNTAEKLKLDINLGFIASALNARHIRRIQDAAQLFVSSSTPPPTPQSSVSDGDILEQVDVTLRIRGFGILLLPFSASMSQTESEPLKSFFIKPLSPPRLPYGYLRIQLDSFFMSLSAPTSSPNSTPYIPHARRSSTYQRRQLVNCTLADISVFSFHPYMTKSNDIASSPIIITDPHLLSSYYGLPMHIHPYTDQEKANALPSLDIVDLTRGERRGAGSKHWRTKVPQHLRKTSGLGTGFVSNVGLGVGLSTSPSRGIVSSPPKPTSLPSSPRQAEGISVTSAPALSIKCCWKTPKVAEVDVQTLPLHVFIDLASTAAVLQFLEDLDPLEYAPTSPIPSTSLKGDYASEVTDAPSATAQFGTSEYEREKERKRLERLVLDDLDLELDYGRPDEDVPRPPCNAPSSTKPQLRSEIGIQAMLHIPLLRLQVCTPPPPNRQQRSGSLIIDLHSIGVTSNPSFDSEQQARHARFEDITDLHVSILPELNEGEGKTLALVELGRIVIAYSLVGEARAIGLISIGPLATRPGKTDGKFGASPTTLNEIPLPPSIVIRSNPPPAPSQTATTALIMNIPSIYINLYKPYIDGIQLWADDIAQWSERVVAGDTGADNVDGSRTPSLIGSRFFARRSTSGSNESGSVMGTSPVEKRKSELAVKLTLSEAIIRLNLSTEKNDKDDASRLLDIEASDVGALVEIKPEGKEETVITLDISDITVVERFSGTQRNIFSSTRSRSLNAASRTKIRFHSMAVPETTAKESKVKITLCGFTYDLRSDFDWLLDLAEFVKAPPGAFESVVPSERTSISIKIVEGAIRITPPVHPSALVVAIEELEFSTDLVGEYPETSLKLSVPAFSILFIDDVGTLSDMGGNVQTSTGMTWWKKSGYALLAETNDLDTELVHNTSSGLADTRITVHRLGLRLHLCADTISGITAFASDLQSAFQKHDQVPTTEYQSRHVPIAVSQPETKSNLSHSLDEHAFRKVPDVGSAPDMINDDLPNNVDYIDASFGTAAGLRELRDDDLDDFDLDHNLTGRVTPTQPPERTGIVSNIGGETIKMFYPSLDIIENFYDQVLPDSGSGTSEYGETTVRLRLHNCDLRVFLYEGYDWSRTRKTIEEEMKEVRKRLAKIRQLLATGQTLDHKFEETSTLLFNSVYVGLEQDTDELEPIGLIAAIDEELNEDVETASQSSWQSFKPQSRSKPKVLSSRSRNTRLNRPRGPSIEFCLLGLDVEVDQYRPNERLVSRVLATVRDLEILDHIKTSTWSKFLTQMHSDSRGNIRETDSNMLRIELLTLLPVPDHPNQEARLKAKLLPLRLYMDQDALDFMKKFFSFHDSQATPPAPPENEIFFQHVEVFPVDIKLDYKPRRVDYRALKEGKTIELMNFFHFDGAEMTLRHITLKGITGWPRLGDTLNDLWTPDVKANQLAEFISGVAPIRSVVNVGSGVADLVLLPIAQYKKDGRIIRGMQKGTTAFVKSTAMEAIKLGARLATGTQVILEQADNVLGGQFKDSITAETLQDANVTVTKEGDSSGDESDRNDLISKYADQPTNVKEGVQLAYKTLSKNIISAGQTILAVPMEVYERSGSEGPARAVVRAVPIAVLKPMIGASEAVSKTLLGLRNTLDPDNHHENEAKYKR